MSRQKFLYTEWIKNKVLLYSTGSHIQYLVTNHKEKEYKKIYIYMYLIDSLGYIEEINSIVSQLYLNKIN